LVDCHPGGFNHLVLSFRYRCSYILKDLRIPFLNASIMSILLLLCAAAMLIRVLLKIKQKEKERLGTKITALERELQAFKEKVE